MNHYLSCTLQRQSVCVVIVVDHAYIGQKRPVTCNITHNAPRLQQKYCESAKLRCPCYAALHGLCGSERSALLSTPLAGVQGVPVAGVRTVLPKPKLVGVLGLVLALALVRAPVIPMMPMMVVVVVAVIVPVIRMLTQVLMLVE